MAQNAGIQSNQNSLVKDSLLLKFDADNFEEDNNQENSERQTEESLTEEGKNNDEKKVYAHSNDVPEREDKVEFHAGRRLLSGDLA